MALESSSEAELARRCRRGDPDAWAELVRRFTPLVYRLSFRMVRDGAEAEDVSQEVFLRMHRSFDSYDPSRPLAPWVSRTTYHACLRRLQATARKAGQLAREPSLAEEVSCAPSPEHAATINRTALFMSAAIVSPCLPAPGCIKRSTICNWWTMQSLQNSWKNCNPVKPGPTKTRIRSRE